MIQQSVLETPVDLFGKVMRKIAAARLRGLYFRLSLVAVGIMASVTYLVLNSSALWAQIQQSSLMSLLRLAVTDTDVVFANLKDLALGFLEAIPTETILFASICLFCLVSLYGLADGMRRARQTYV